MNTIAEFFTSLYSSIFEFFASVGMFIAAHPVLVASFLAHSAFAVLSAWYSGRIIRMIFNRDGVPFWRIMIHVVGQLMLWAALFNLYVLHTRAWTIAQILA